MEVQIHSFTTSSLASKVSSLACREFSGSTRVAPDLTHSLMLVWQPSYLRAVRTVRREVNALLGRKSAVPTLFFHCNVQFCQLISEQCST